MNKKVIELCVLKQITSEMNRFCWRSKRAVLRPNLPVIPVHIVIALVLSTLFRFGRAW